MVQGPSVGGEVVWPRYGADSILGLSRAVRGFFEGSGSMPPLDTTESDGMDKILLMVVDGLGMAQLEYGIGEGVAPNLERVMEDGGLLRLVTTLPSTTTAALTTLCTGVPPEEHGMLGYRLFLEEVEDVVDMLMFITVGSGRSLSAMGLNPRSIIDTPTLLDIIGSRGQEVFGLTREEFLVGPLTEILYGGGNVIGYSNCRDLMRKTARLCQHEGEALIFAYWDAIDTTSHRSGSQSDAFLTTLSGFDRALGDELLSAGTGNVLLLVTADHGLIDCPPEDNVDLREHSDLVATFSRTPAGEPRLPYLNVEPDMKRKAMDYLDDHLLDVAHWMTTEEALGAHLFGPDGNPRWRHRIGDLVLFPREQACFTYPYPGEPSFVARHGGVSAQEMSVPLLWTHL